MDADRIVSSLDTLSLGDLRRIRGRVDELIALMEGWQQPDSGPSKTYKQEFVKCGKMGCKTCQHGPGHGPYWYSYWREGKRVRKQYHGKNKPLEV